MMTIGRQLAAATAGGFVIAFGLPAWAQARADGFALDRFEPSERGSDWFANESLDLRGHQRFAAGLVGDYAYKPLVVYRPDGEERSAIVAHQLYAHLGGAVTLWNRLKLAVNLPIALYQQGEAATTSTATFQSSNKTIPGDLRVGAQVRLLGHYRQPLSLAAGLQLFAPTGSRDSYTSDGKVRVYPAVLVAGEVTPFVYAGRLGVNIRALHQDYAGIPTGTEVSLGAAAGVRVLDGKAIVGPELMTSTVVTDSSAFFARRTTPLELILGGHYEATDSWRFGAGVGPGLTRGFGTPAVRALVSAEWIEPVPPQVQPPMDRDGDGIPDADDACPDKPGVRTTDPKTNGCPPPPGDRDKDGILDPQDACPDVPGVATDDPKTNGCPPAPPPDRDGDGVPDTEDACPDVPGVKTTDPKTNGCPTPPADRDGDGIIDPEDACPDQPGPRNDDPKKNGCPVARVESGQIKIREQVQFAYDSSRILRQSDFILEAVLKILQDNPGIKRVEVQGYTDSRGSGAYNKKLSERRAKAVLDWLTSHGVNKARLTSSGFGMDRPIDTNDTEEGRANNRRVEFHIIDNGGAPGSKDTPPR